MNRKPLEKRAQILGMLCEGLGVKATARLAGVSHVTVLKLVEEMGDICAAYLDKSMRNLTCKRLQLDEIWSFVYAKQRNASKEMSNAGAAGDIWTWTAIDADTKLIPCYFMGKRDAESADLFISDLAERLTNRVQLTTDGLKVYIEAIDNSFGSQIDYAMLIKHYGESPEGTRRYSPAQITSIETNVINGNPNPKHISTSYNERHNLNIRMQNRRFTRLTNGYSKKIENHEHMMAIYTMFYNFAKIHSAIRCTPAMEAGISKTIWTVEDICRLAD